MILVVQWIKVSCRFLCHLKDYLAKRSNLFILFFISNQIPYWLIIIDIACYIKTITKEETLVGILVFQWIIVSYNLIFQIYNLFTSFFKKSNTILVNYNSHFMLYHTNTNEETFYKNLSFPMNNDFLQFDFPVRFSNSLYPVTYSLHFSKNQIQSWSIIIDITCCTNTNSRNRPFWKS